MVFSIILFSLQIHLCKSRQFWWVGKMFVEMRIEVNNFNIDEAMLMSQILIKLMSHISWLMRQISIWFINTSLTLMMTKPYN